MDGVLPSSSQKKIAGATKSNWDKTTFRVSRIPERLRLEDLSRILVQIFGVTVTNFSIHSLALDVSDEADPTWKTATVSFRVIPALLGLSPDLAGYWDFDMPPIAAAKFGTCRIFFDTHFDGFTPLSPANHTPRPIDCIVVPGWGGHALGSFMSPTSPYVWLRDSLPHHCPELRVWTYGYPSHLTDAKSSADPYEFAERFRIALRILRQQTRTADEVRPLVFIAHSLGGWIFKDAMIQMRKSSDDVDQETVLSTYGALFFGVPTQGMDVEAIANMVQNLPARYISTLLDQKNGFRLRQRQHDDFCQAFDYEDSKIVQFFELEKSPTVIQDPRTKKWSRSGPLALLVNPASATHGRAWEIGSEYTFSLAGNHSSMIKFPNDRNDYPTVRSCLQQFTKQAALVIGNRWKKCSDELKPSDHNDLTFEQKDCLQSLSFPEMNERRNGIDDPANGTCEWLSENRTYLKWFDQQHGMLWIKGKPGAGKSTLIKHAVSGLEQFRGGYAVLASFFFHGRGALIQKNIAGLFRSLLHQLLLQIPELLTKFSSLHKKRTEREGQCGNKWEWHEKELRNFFKAHVTEAARTRTVRLYIDALDEAGEDTATELVHFFQQLSSSLAVCFSCRHYPLLTLENGLEVCVEDRNGQDIDTYIRARINNSNIPLCDEIAAKSLGSFQWVALVIRLILRLHRNGKSLAVLSSKIKQLPSELNELYKELLGSLDEEDLSESLLLMQWILFSLRPLKLSELRFALVMGQESTCASVRECQNSSCFSSTDEDLKRKILALSRGLVEVRELSDLSNDYYRIDSVASTKARYASVHPDSKLRVQFVHQSVKDFLLEGGLHMLDRGSLEDAIGRGHSNLARSCINYINLEDVRDWWFTVPSFFCYDFLSYAAQYWYLHLEEAEKRVSPQACLLSMLGMSWVRFMQTWIRLLFRKFEAGDTEFVEVDWSLLHVASKLNLPSLVSAIIGRGVAANLRVRGGRTPLSIAAKAGSEQVVKVLLDRHDVDPNPVDDDGCTPLVCAMRSGSKATFMLLLNRKNIDLNLQDQLHISPLYRAFEYCDEDTVETFLQRTTIDTDCKGFLGKPPLYLAARFGWEAIVKLLLDRKNVDPNTQYNNGRTPLSYAAERGEEAIVKMLLDRKDINVKIQDNDGRTPLSYAALMGRESIVKMLLDRKDITVKIQDNDGRTPLSYAALMGRRSIVEQLINRKDTNPNVQDRNGRTPLHSAAVGAYKEIVQLLLDRDDVHPNDPDISGTTPLDYADSLGHAETATMLRDRMRRDGLEGWK